jgi:hypothetical protein
MATDTRAAFISLEQLRWSNFLTVTGGGGVSDYSVAPFLWVVFFKIERDSLFGECIFTPGDHRNLGVSDVDPGAVISIPDALGTASFSLAPIELLDGTKVAPTFGVVAVLMRDGGHITAHGIKAGHDTLNFGVRGIINDLANTAINQRSPVTDQQISAAVMSSNISQRVSDAVRNAQSFWENVWACSGADSEIDHVVGTWTTDKFANPSETKSVSMVFVQSQWSSWTIDGSVTVVDACPASSSASALDRALVQLASERGLEQRRKEHVRRILTMLLGSIREFRDRKSLLRDNKFNVWWTVLTAHAPELAYRLAMSREAQEAAVPLIDTLVAHLQDDSKVLSGESISGCLQCLEAVHEKATSRLRNDVRSIISILPHLEGKTFPEALEIVTSRSVTASPESPQGNPKREKPKPRRRARAK